MVELFFLFSFKELFNLFNFCLRSYLLALDSGASCFTSNDVASLLGQDPVKFAKKYDGGMLKKIKIFKTILFIDKLIF